jgi:hypothetical protein
MAHDLQVKVERGHLVPVMSDGQETLDGLEGETFRAVLTQAKGRSWSQLKLYFAMADMISKNLAWDLPLSKGGVDTVLRVETGHADPVKFADGTYRMVPRSIAFNQLSPEAFGKFLDRAFDAAAIKFGPELTDAVRVELYKLMDGEWSEREDRP